MFDAAGAFCSGMYYRDQSPYWLTLAGASGTGKTHLAQHIERFTRATCEGNWPRFLDWSKFMGRMRTPGIDVAESVEALASPYLLAVDDIGIGTDTRDFALDLLLRVMNSRRDRWTMFTSNVSLGALAEIDTRLASRLNRCGIIVACEAQDYALRATT